MTTDPVSLVAELRQEHDFVRLHTACEAPSIAECEAGSICGCCQRAVGYPCTSARAADLITTQAATIARAHDFERYLARVAVRTSDPDRSEIYGAIQRDLAAALGPVPPTEETP